MSRLMDLMDEWLAGREGLFLPTGEELISPPDIIEVRKEPDHVKYFSNPYYQQMIDEKRRKEEEEQLIASILDLSHIDWKYAKEHPYLLTY